MPAKTVSYSYTIISHPIRKVNTLPRFSMQGEDLGGPRLFRRGRFLQTPSGENFPGRRPPVKQWRRGALRRAGAGRGIPLLGEGNRKIAAGRQEKRFAGQRKPDSRVCCPVFDSMGLYAKRRPDCRSLQIANCQLSAQPQKKFPGAGPHTHRTFQCDMQNRGPAPGKGLAGGGLEGPASPEEAGLSKVFFFGEALSKGGLCRGGLGGGGPRETGLSRRVSPRSSPMFIPVRG